MRGFTTVRDLGGPAFGLKGAIDEGIVKGPRIYPSGAVITVTSGHGDFRQLTDLPRTMGGMLTRKGAGLPEFDPFANDMNFLLGGMLFEDVGVTAHRDAGFA